MESLTRQIETLFARYIKAWNARDFERVAACYAEPSLFVLPHASIPVPDRAAMVALLENLFAGLEADGFSHSEIGQVTARACGDGLAVVDARDVMRLRADGSVLEAIDAHYVARQTDGEWQFTMALTCTPGWQEN